MTRKKIAKHGDILRTEVIKQREAFEALGRDNKTQVSSRKRNRFGLLVKRDDGSSSNFEAEKAKIRDLMEEVGIKDQVNRENYLLHLYLHEKAAHEKNLLHEKAAHEKNLLHEKALHEKKDQLIGSLNTIMKSADRKVLVRDAAIGYRSNIEKLEKLIFPDWIMSTTLTRFQRFLMALTICTTKYSIVLQQRLTRDHVPPYEFSLAMDQYYDDLSRRFNHFGKVITPKTEAEWEELYSFFGATHEYEKKALKISLEGLPLSPEITGNEGEIVNRYFAFLEGVDFSATNRDVEELFKTIDGNATTHAHIIKKYKGLPTGYIAVDFIGSKPHTVDKIRSTILNCRKKPFHRQNFDVKVYTETGDKSEGNPTGTPAL